ncbi:hypothetical protein BT63DRAFT_461464 [Microthyrium microscopicum]|uniref:ABM domain-containing protein n=1 Tax=Microthyrium microscopicum TaxID=703497 RepID=A0A6A6TTG4_9PEZI|nr:hypothetical protein BT63DRAFT_461464 [Microthyrium microscopicum]
MVITSEDHFGTMQKRLTWTLFHHASTKPWPTWPNGTLPREGQNLDPYFEVLCHVPGVENVRIGRKVEDVDQAAYIVLWSSADALASFQASALFPDFLRLLPIGNEQSEAYDTSLSRIISLQFDHGFDMDTELYGRVTLNKFTGLADWESWHWGVRKAFNGFFPLGCMDIHRKRPPMYHYCVTWVDQQGGEQQGMWDWDPSKSLEDKPEIKKVIARGDEHVRERWEFLRWNQPIYYGATREREEESTKQPGAMQHWEKAIQRAMPPIQTWVQERWDIEKPYFPIAPDEDDVDIDMEDLELDEEDEFSACEELEEDDSLPVSIR